MRALYTREDLASIMNRNATTIHEHIKKLGIKPFKRKNRFMMYDDSVIDLLNNSINKREITKYLAIFLEKAASPIPVAKYPSGYTTEQKSSLLNIIKKFQTKTALVVPKELELQFLESKSVGEAYRSAINIFNMFIGRCLFIPDLLGFQGDETSGGSYSLGKEQMSVFFMHIG